MLKNKITYFIFQIYLIVVKDTKLLRVTVPHADIIGNFSSVKLVLELILLGPVEFKHFNGNKRFGRNS